MKTETIISFVDELRIGVNSIIICAVDRYTQVTLWTVFLAHSFA